VRAPDLQTGSMKDRLAVSGWSRTVFGQVWLRAWYSDVFPFCAANVIVNASAPSKNNRLMALS